MRVFKGKITKCIVLNKYQHPLSLISGGDGVSAVYGTYWSLQPLCHLFYFLSHTGIYFCWAHSLLIMFLWCYFLLCSKLSYTYNPWLFIPWSLFRNTKSLGFGFCLLCAKYFTIWTSSSIIYQSHWSPQFNISVVRHVVFFYEKATGYSSYYTSFFLHADSNFKLASFYWYLIVICLLNFKYCGVKYCMVSKQE